MPVHDEFSPYDPLLVRSGPPDSPPPTSTLFDAEGTPLPSFDQRFAEDLDGLLYLGALSKTFVWLGHTFVIRSLTQGELLTVPVLIKPWLATIGENKAYAVAMVSSCIVSVDGKSLPIPFAENGDPYALARNAFDYVLRSWFQFTIDRIYNEYISLEIRVSQVVEAMEKASGPGASTDGSNTVSAGPSDKDS